MNPDINEGELPVSRAVLEAYAAGQLEDAEAIELIESDTTAMELVGRIQVDNDFLTQLKGAWSTGGGTSDGGPPRQTY